MTRGLLLAIGSLLVGCASDPVAPPCERDDPPLTEREAAEEREGRRERTAGPEYVRLGPEPLPRPEDAGIGQPVPDAAFVDLTGRPGSLREQRGDAPALVVVFTTLGCPVSKAYAPLLEDLSRACAERGAAFLVVDPAIQDSEAELRAKADRMGWSFRITRDPDYALTEALGAERTADAFVVTPAGLAYRGAVDDQFGINYRLPAPRNRYLLEALDAVVTERAPQVAATDAPGCLIAKVRRSRK